VSAPCVRADRLSKRFSLITSKRSTLRTLLALVGGEPLQREHWVLKELTFEIQPGDKLALIGRNGSGKTTLLRILTGIYRQTAGSLVLTRRAGALLDCSSGFQRELSVLDNLYLFGALRGIGREILQPREQSILELAELEEFAHTPLKDLSLGQTRRLALSVFSQTRSDFLVFDEVLTNLDPGFRHKAGAFFGALANSSSFLRTYCTKALWLEDGRLRRAGPLAEVLDEYEASFPGQR
jgi:ABC-2 type transport system ATP-binding protein